MKKLQIKKLLLLLVLTLLNISCVAQRGASHYDKKRSCWGERDTFTDFGPAGCDDAVTIAGDSDGEYWRFSNTCLPGGFESLTDWEIQDSLVMSPTCAALDESEMNQ